MRGIGKTGWGVLEMETGRKAEGAKAEVRLCGWEREDGDVETEGRGRCLGWG